MRTEMQLYGQVILSERVQRAALKMWDKMDDESRKFYVQNYPASAISCGIDPSPYLEGSDVDLGAVMEYIARESVRRSEE